MVRTILNVCTLSIFFIFAKGEILFACDPPELNGNFILCKDQSTEIDAGPGYEVYQWSNGGSNQLQEFTLPGSYSVTVTDSEGCTSSTAFDINAFTVQIELLSSPGNCGGGLVSYIVTAQNIPEFPWFFRVRRDGIDGSSITNLYQSGVSNSTVIQIDVNTFQTTTFTLLEGFTPNCEALVLMPESFEVLINNIDETPQIVGGPFVCVGSLPEPTELMVEPAFSTYAWSNGETTQTILVDNPGIYTVTVTDMNGCVAIANIFLSGIGDLGFFIFGETSICPGGEVTLTGFPFDEGPIDWSTGETGPSIIVTEPGTYEATITRTCKDLASITVTLVEDLEVSIIGATEICEGGTILLSTDGLFESYQWSTGSTLSEIAVDAPGNYSVTVTNSQGCQGETSINIEVLDPDPITIQVQGVLCNEGDEVILQVEPGFETYTWSNGQGTPIVSVQTPGDYAVTVVDASGCLIEGNTTVEESPPFEIFISGVSELCIGQSGTLELSEGPFSNVIWSSGETDVEITVSSPGLYSVTVANLDGCEASTSFEVQLFDTGLNIEGTNAICAGQEGNLIAQLIGSASLLWSTGESGSSITIFEPGIYSVEATYDNGCMVSSSFEVEEQSIAAPIILAPSFVCEGQIFELSIPDIYDNLGWSDGQIGATILADSPGIYSVTVSLNGCEAESSIEIFTQDAFIVEIFGDPIICSDFTELNVLPGFIDIVWSQGSNESNILVSDAGNYSVTVTDVSGCTGIGQIEINVSNTPPPQIDGISFICPGELTTLSVSGNFLDIIWSTGAFSSQIQVFEAGTYEVSVTDQDGCTQSNSVVIEEGDLPEIEVFINGLLCDGGVVELIAQSSLVDPEFLWSNGSNEQVILINLPGTYIVTVSEAGSCSNTNSIEVSLADQPDVFISGASSICNGQESTLTAISSADFFLWSNGESTPTITITEAGTYSVTVSELNGCTNEASIEIIEDANLNFTIQAPDAICPETSGILQAPIGFESYEWSNGSTSPQIEITEAGSYTLTITDLSGCSGSASVTVSIYDEQIIEIATDGTLCEGDSLMLSVSTEWSDISWSTGSTLESIFVSESGTYTINAIDLNGCIAMGSIEILAEAGPTTSFEAPDGICPESNATLTILTDLENQILWGDLSNNPSLEISEPGTYTAIVTNLNGCITEVSISVPSYIAPTVEIIGSNRLCPGSEITLELLTDASTFQWNTGSIESSFLVNLSGAYQVTVSDENGCTAFTSIEIVESDSIEINIFVAPYNCDGTLQLSIDEELNEIQWSNGLTSSMIAVTENGIYSVEARDASGCSGRTDIDITIPIILDLTLSSNDFFCPGQTELITASLGFENYLWNNGEIGTTIEILDPGVYTVTATDENACTASQSIQVDWFPLLNLEIQVSGILCEGDSIILSVADEFQTYVWSNGIETPSLFVNDTGLYQVIVTDINGCEQRDSLTLNIGSDTNASIEMEGSLCDPNGIRLNIQTLDTLRFVEWNNGSSETFLDVFSPDEYSVLVATNEKCPILLSTLILPAEEIIEFYTQLFSCEKSEWGIDSTFINNSNGCDSLFIIEIIPGQPVSIELASIEGFCPQDSIIANIIIEGPNEGLVQLMGNGQIKIKSISGEPLKFDLTELDPGLYEIVILELPDGFCASDNSLVIEVEDRTWDAMISVTDDEINNGYLLNILSDRQLSSITWFSDGSLSCEDCFSPVAIPLEDVSYSALLIDMNGCELLLEIFLKSIDNPEKTNIYIPNAFSPNGDGINDNWRIFSNESLQIISIQVFDRYGNIIWFKNDVSENDPDSAWDGSRNGQLLNPGVYIWKAVVKTSSGQIRTLSGEVNLLE